MMAERDRERWDATYRKRQEEPYPAADPLLLQYTPPAPPTRQARALDLAGGLGQNGLWLAAQGYAVDVMDISRVALARAHEEASRRRLRKVSFLHVDLEDMALEASAYDVVCVFRYLQRDLFPLVRAAVRPGGRVLYETFNLRYLAVNPQFNPDYLLRPGELAGYFADWKLLCNAEHQHVSQLVAIKPRANS